MSIEADIEKRKKDWNTNYFIVAEQNEEILGFARYTDYNRSNPNDANIDSEIGALYVKTELKRSGIGTLLFNYITDSFKQKGKTKMILWCLKENYPSRKFYEKMGGKVYSYQNIKIGEQFYEEVGYVYDLTKK